MIWVKYLDTEVEECWYSAEETKDWMELQQRPEWATILLLQMQPLARLGKNSGLPGCSWSALVFSNELASPEWRLCDHSKDSSLAPRSSSLLRLLSLEWSLSPIAGVSNVCTAFSQPPGFLTLDVLMLSYESYFHQALGVVVLSCLHISHVLLWCDFLPKLVSLSSTVYLTLIVSFSFSRVVCQQERKMTLFILFFYYIHLSYFCWLCSRLATEMERNVYYVTL